MAHTWQLHEAKSKFSEVIEEALHNGPQIITRRGVKTAVVMSYADYRRMMFRQKKLSDFFRESPFIDVDLDLTRDISPARSDFAL